MVVTRARWTPPVGFREWLESIKDRVSDLSPATEQITKRWYKRAVEYFESEGHGDWKVLAPATIKRWGQHPVLHGQTGLLRRRIIRDWSSNNAVLIDDAPHAQFADKGTARHYASAGQRTTVYQTDNRRHSRAETRKRVQATTSESHEPERMFIFVDDVTRAEAPEIVVDFILGELDTK